MTMRYPSTKGVADLPARLGHLISPYELHLPSSVFSLAQKVASDLYHHTHEALFLSAVRERVPPHERELLDAPRKNHAVLMCYDFHYNSDSDELHLIEVNANASAFLISDLLYRSDGSRASSAQDPLHLLRHSFESELRLGGQSVTPRVAIVDDNVLSQKMYIEFLMYRDLFEEWGWPAHISECSDIAIKDVDLIYNRSTDFTFSGPTTRHLREAYLSGPLPVISPHPREYILMADKSRLMEIISDREAPELASPAKPPSHSGRSPLSETLLPVFELDKHTDLENVWKQRHSLFFKPKRLFGSKAVYRGSTISRKKFDELVGQDFLAQKYAPPGTWVAPDTKEKWKFDLRFYAYEDQIHLAVARLYQGQVTNFNTPGGGLARVRPLTYG